MSSKTNRKKDRPTQAEITALTNEWYAKLAKEGFEDIEWYNPASGKGQNSRFLKKSIAPDKLSNMESTLTHFRLLQNYLHNVSRLPKFSNIQPQVVRFCFKCYINGDSYRTIIAKSNKKFKPRGFRHMSLRPLHAMLKKLIKIAYRYNRRSPEGLLYQVSDVNILDVMIAEPIPAMENKDPYLADEPFDLEPDFDSEFLD